MGTHDSPSYYDYSVDRSHCRDSRLRRRYRNEPRDYDRYRRRDHSSDRRNDNSRRRRDHSYDRHRRDRSPRKYTRRRSSSNSHDSGSENDCDNFPRNTNMETVDVSSTPISDLSYKPKKSELPPITYSIIKNNSIINKVDNPTIGNNLSSNIHIMVSSIGDDATKKRKTSRFAPETDRFTMPGIPVAIAADMDENQRKLYLTQLRIEEIGLKLRTGNLSINDLSIDRSPSPEPIYNSMGIRQNTRELRVRQKLEEERHKLINDAKELNPEYKPPLDYRPTSTKITDKVMIPQDVHPSINFIGLLIGPRGNTLKRLESESNTKIIIRGKGSLKEGKLRTQPLPGEDEPLHALVTANNPEDLRKGMALIKSIIDDGLANPDGENELRRMQLRELAQLNGTLIASEISRCKNCGASDHRHWECPQAKNITNITICDKCGGGGHIASDCIYDGERAQTAEEKSKLDSAYKELMTELGVDNDVDASGNNLFGDTSNGKNIPSILALPKVVVSQLPWANNTGGHLAGSSTVTPLALPSTVPMMQQSPAPSAPPPPPQSMQFNMALPPAHFFPGMPLPPPPSSFASAPLAEAFGLPQQNIFPSTNTLWNNNNNMPNVTTNDGVRVTNINNNNNTNSGQ